MPEVFNFTARATAASGAFADRDFSITVNNNILQRLLVIGQSGVARSTGAGPWVLVPGVKGDSGDWGDRWLIWDQAAGVMWQAPDGINFTSFVPTFPAGYTRFGFLRWRADGLGGGAWWAMASADQTAHWEHGVVTSTDGGQTWSLVGGTITHPSLALSFERSEAGASIIATGTEWHYRASDGDAWAVVRTVANSYRFQIAHLNGAWFGPADQAAAPGVARSVDGATWFDQSTPSVLTAGYYRGFAYTNGAVIGHNYYDPLTGYTLDAGLTVQATAALPAASQALDVERPIVSQGGRTYVLGDTGRVFLMNSLTGGISALNLPAPLTVPACLAVRV